MKIPKRQFLSRVFGIFISGIIATSLLTSCSQNDQVKPIKLAGIAFDDEQDAEAGYIILSELIEEATGRPVEFFETSDYSALTESFLAGQVDIAQLTDFSYVVAKSRKPSIQLLAASARQRGMQGGGVAYGITPETETGISELKDLRGRSLCFSDPASSAGYLWPSYFMYEAGLNPKLGEGSDVDINFVGSFPQVATSVANGDCEAGFILDSFFDVTLQDSEVVDINQLQIFWKSPARPGQPLAYNAQNISESEAQSIQNVLLEKGNKDFLVENGVCEERSSCRLLSASAWGYAPVQDSDFDLTRKMCARLELEQCR